MNMRSILAHKGAEVLSVDSACKVAEAIDVLERRGVGCLVISKPDNPLAGIFSERDLVRAMHEKGAMALDFKVRDFMTEDLVTVKMDTTVVEAMEIMTTQRLRHLPVMEKNKLCGLVSIGDVVKKRIQDTELEAQALKSYIVAG